MRPFAYEEPASVAEVLSTLAAHGPDARLLAGGQSLLILMRQRLVSPTVLVALGRVEGIRGIEAQPDGSIRLGAMVTYREAAGSETVRGQAPVLARAAGSVGSMHIRELGTVGGAMCHADPAGDILTVMMVLDGWVEITSPAGTETIEAGAFPTGLFETRLPAGGLLTALRVPEQPAGARYGYQRFMLREGEYPMTQAAIRVSVREGRLSAVRVAVGGGADRPMRLEGVEAWLEGAVPTDGLIDDLLANVRASVTPYADVRGSSAWKAQVVGVMAKRALAEALGKPVA